MKPTHVAKVMQKDLKNFYLKQLHINKIFKRQKENKNKNYTIGHLCCVPLQFEYVINRLNAWIGPDSWVRAETNM